MRRWAGVVACGLVPVACSLGQPEVDLVAIRLSADEAQSWSTVGLGARHEITVRRTLRTSRCSSLDADAVLAGGEITLRVRAARTGGDCPPGEVIRGYLAAVRGLRPGRYDFRVVHIWASGRRPSTVVLSHPVVVE